MRLRSLKGAFQNPVLLWLFCLSLLMYGFSHVPYVFGQPFILQALDTIGLTSEAPIISGATASAMMIVSVLVSLIAPGLRRAMGLPALLLLAFGMQVALAGILALTNSAWAIAVLFLRMVPDSLSRPFILARIQPMLVDDTRATYLSLRSFCGRLLFAATLYLASLNAADVGLMPRDDLQAVLGAYALAGIVCFAVLAFWARKTPVEPAERG